MGQVASDRSLELKYRSNASSGTITGGAALVHAVITIAVTTALAAARVAACAISTVAAVCIRAAPGFGVGALIVLAVVAPVVVGVTYKHWGDHDKF